MSNIRLILESQYFPSIGWFILAHDRESVYIDVSENYNKRSLRNKAILSSANGPSILSVPLRKGKHQNKNITQVKIAYAEDWVDNHVKTLRTVYGKSPYFMYYFHEISELLSRNSDTLIELNQSIIKYLSSILDLKITLQAQELFIKSSDEKHIVLRDTIAYTGAFSPLEKQLYITLQLLSSQVDSPLTLWPRSSILDLLFYLGPETAMALNWVGRQTTLRI